MIVPALLPPPAPFKIFVLLAGVAAIPVWQFVARHRHRPRSSATAAKGCWRSMYGDAASAFLHDHAKEAGLWLAGIALVLGVAGSSQAVECRRRRMPDLRDGSGCITQICCTSRT